MKWTLRISLLLLILGAIIMTLPHPGDSGAAVAHDDHDHDHKLHPHADKLKNDDGSWKYTNKLLNESSPYLLQHAHNPVDWHPWGKEAFEKARKEDKLIFLSIGYSTCYWCHVMERLVFENPKIAEQMNKLFVCVKVDREERPDVDDIYMAATQMMSGGGGWPMSVFLTPPGAAGEKDAGLKPFFAGTYFPPEPMQGRPSFPQIMTAVDQAWSTKKPQVVAQADRVAESVTEYLGTIAEPGEVHPAFVEGAADSLLRMYDETHGGFGGAPKFPTPNNVLFLMHDYQKNPTAETWNAIAYTLERMARGGMYDQIGGGFHRYSVDARWLVPHFEKMLYDNGQLVETYLIAQSIKPDEKDPQLYPRVAREILEYVLREMTDETGTFWSAQDAEVDAKEGDNYVWTEKQVRAAIDDKELADLAVTMFGLDKGPNFKDPHDPHATPVNVIYLPQRLDELAAARKMSMEELLQKRDTIRKQLLTVRDKRKQPGTDDKVLTSWNGLMIAGFARAGHDLKEPRYVTAAARAADYILEHMRTEDGGLYRTMRKGKAKIPGFLEDYAFFVRGLLALHRADGDSKWLDAAEKLTKLAQEKFATDMGGYYDTLADQADLFVRTRTTYDGATPSGNSVFINNLLSLHEATKKDEYVDDAIRDLKSFSTVMRRQGVGVAHMLEAAGRAIELAPDRFPKGGALAGKAEPTEDNPVVAALAAKEVTLKDGVGTVTVTMKIHKSFHANANKPGVDGVVPTTLSLSGVKGIELTVKYPAGEKKKFAFADTPMAVYEGEVTIEATLKKTGPVAITGEPRLILGYQVCTDQACLLPAEVRLPIVIEGLD